MEMHLACRATFLEVEDEGFSESRSARRAKSEPPASVAQCPARVSPALNTYLSTVWARSGSLIDRMKTTKTDSNGSRTSMPDMRALDSENPVTSMVSAGAAQSDIQGIHSDIQGGRTLIIRNLPCRVTQEDLVQVIDSLGLSSRYNYVYIPSRNRSHANKGYGFINVHTEEDEELFARVFDGLPASRFEGLPAARFTGKPSNKVCKVERSRLQGLDTNMAQFDRRKRKGFSLPLQLGGARE